MKKILSKESIIVFILVLVVGVFFTFLFINSQGNKNKIPDNYIAVFHGGSGEVTYSTYIYKIKNDQPNYGFQYINTKNTTVSWGSSKQKQKIIGRGNIDWTDGVFSIAHENNAYSYVTLPDGSKYSIEEFQGMFLMN